jgi:DNA-binding transcriptional LysR family regulator
MDLLALSDFNAVARHGGFGRAARATGRPKATLSRRVAELERSLNLRLFERGGRTLKLTEEGRALFERTATLLTEIDETAAAIASGGARPRGTLRISAPLFFAQTAMGKLAAGFALEFPDIRLEVTTEDRAVDMIEEGYDLVIRVNPPVDENLIGRIFLHDRLVVVASPVMPHPGPTDVVKAVIRGPGDRHLVWNIVSAAGPSSMTIDPVLSLSSLVMVRDAVLAGVGVARLPVSLVGHDLRDGRLAHWADIHGPAVALWALYPSRRLLSARVSAFLDYLRRAFPRGEPEELAAFMARSPVRTDG